MAEEHLVVQGATCRCNFGTAPDQLKVLTHQREYGNDKDSVKKYIASTKDIGTTFEKNTFGSCSKQNNKPCNAVVSEWKGFYEKTTLTNGGKVLLESSKATCPVGGPDCILIVKHGQIAQVGKQNVDNAKPAISNALNPAVDIRKLKDQTVYGEGIILE